MGHLYVLLGGYVTKRCLKNPSWVESLTVAWSGEGISGVGSWAGEEEWEGTDIGAVGLVSMHCPQTVRGHTEGPGESPISSVVTCFPKQKAQRFSLPWSSLAASGESLSRHFHFSELLPIACLSHQDPSPLRTFPLYCLSLWATDTVVRERDDQETPWTLGSKCPGVRGNGTWLEGCLGLSFEWVLLLRCPGEPQTQPVF